MKRTISAGDARKRLGELLESVYYRDDEVVVERDGKPMAVVIPVHLYEAIERDRERVFDFIRRVQERNRDVPFETIQAEVNAAVEEVRREQREQRQARTG